ncbi:restriction endonuclease subunit S [Parvularcula lutaonensis]|uniref:Restriction endonuclease subunit S n=1 Tax=Parvularcula lutaonensis TaxID=491923 RepID=A0ABV7MAD1_9PROT|nr:restriction endonuclease subunit S [Parvularcula lutaonensis]GGY37694.1 typeI restriction endonuclease MjaXP subunit S [Parvularcula lutaonensis]
MREGWTTAPISDVAAIHSGGTPNKAREDYWGGTIPWVTVKDMKGIRLNGVGLSLTGKGAATVRVVPPGSVLVLVRGMGLFKDLPVTICDRSVAFNQDIKALVPKPNVEPDFLAIALTARKEDILRHVDSAGHGTGRLDTELLKSTPIPLPPLPEQRKIAEILRTWDAALEALTTLRTAKARLRTWFRTHLFTGKARLPGFSGEWREVRLSEVLHEHGLKSTGKEEVYSVSVHKGLVNQIEHLGRSFSAASTDHYNRVLPGDIVYTKSPTGDFPLGIIKQSKIDREVIVSPLYGVFTPRTQALGVILDALFESPVATKNYLRPLVQKGAKNTIAVTNSQFLEGKLRLPMDPDEQAAIAEVVNTSNAELTLIDAEIEALTRQKRGLMQKLLTGEWRVRTEAPVA